MNRFIITLIALLFLTVGYSQTEYTISLGNYRGATQKDFAKIMPYGYVYGVKNGTDYAVYVGWFKDEKTADRQLANVRKTGYNNAKVIQRSNTLGKKVWSVQIASRNTNSSLEWERFFAASQLLTKIEGEKVKIMSGRFDEESAAKKHLAYLEANGFEGAWIRHCNLNTLHQVTAFEAGIPVPSFRPDYEQKEETAVQQETEEPKDVPTEHEETESRVVIFNIDLERPTTHSKATRTSVLELQKLLKKHGAYSGSLDGIYGKGTDSGIPQMIKNHRKYQQFQNMPLSEETKETSALQEAIQNIYSDAEAAKAQLKKETSPVAKAYLAYIYLSSSDDQTEIDEINGLMNQAIKKTFEGYKGDIPFDFTATYAYNNDLPQLIEHLSYIHRANAPDLKVPCWFFEQHPKMLASTFDNGDLPFQLQNCDGFNTWTNIKTLQNIINDIGMQGVIKNQKLENIYKNHIVHLFFEPKKIGDSKKEAVLNWNSRLLSGLDNWQGDNDYLIRTSDAFRLAYFTAWVDLEDYFMNKGFKPSEAKPMAISILQSMIDNRLSEIIAE